MSDTWRKSTHSGSEANCFEVRYAASQIKVRDTKDRHGPAIAVTTDAWRRFTAGIRD